MVFLASVYDVPLPFSAVGGLFLAVFLVGVIYRMVVWAKSPVPYRITTTCGQA